MQTNCRVSNQPFIITDDEIKFYDRISPTFAGQRFQIPTPTLSPVERMRRRTAHRNENFFYRNQSAISNKPFIALFDTDTPYKIVSQAEWNSEQWDPLDYGQPFDSNKSFFTQFHELQLRVPKANVVAIGNENCDYTTGTGYCKNCYLINSSEYCEDCYYGKLFQNSKNCVDCAYVYDSELLYECFNVQKGYNCKYVYNSRDVVDSWFCDNVSGCQNCFLCTNLVNKQYCFMNKQLSQSDYEKTIKEYTDSVENINKATQEFQKLRLARVYKYANIMKSDDCTGDFITASNKCYDCYDINDSVDSRYVQVGVEVSDLLDCSNMYIKPQLSYEVLGTIGTYNVHFSLYVFHSSDIWYSDQIFNSKNCFGCVGLRNKQYCIFNKQYTPEDYEQTVAQIITHMQTTGEWGEYFPIELSPFAYNESVANEYLPLTKDEAIAHGFRWKEPAVQSDSNQNDPTVLHCSVTNKPFKLTPQEIKFYQQQSLPLPTKCPEQRYKERMAIRNPRTLWSRRCSNCTNQFNTTFSPDRTELVYCEQCYQKELY
ncbi:MAG: hypothetical protein WCV88_03445 [Patescibacteria group bacterium]